MCGGKSSSMYEVNSTVDVWGKAVKVLRDRTEEREELE